MRIFSPGLMTSPQTSLTRLRPVPIHGKVIVSEGEEVEANTVLGYYNPHGNITTLNLARELDISPFDVLDTLVKREGDVVFKGEVIARLRGLFSKREFRAPEDGVLERVSRYTGWVTIRGLPMPIHAGFPGVVEKIVPEEGVTLRLSGANIQGIFGIGGLVSGRLDVVPDSQFRVLDNEDVSSNYEGAVLVGGARVTPGYLQRAAKLGIRAVVTGGIHKRDLDQFLGYPLGVAVTGMEPGITVIITEGFGQLPMRSDIWAIVEEHKYMTVYASGSTQVRAGVIRPELFIPGPYRESVSVGEFSQEIAPGARVRVIRAPYFGKHGVIMSAPSLQTLPTESVVLSVQVRLDSGEVKTIPVANLEPAQGRQ